MRKQTLSESNQWAALDISYQIFTDCVWLSNCYLLRIYSERTNFGFQLYGPKTFLRNDDRPTTHRGAQKKLRRRKDWRKRHRERKTARRSRFSYLLRSFVYVCFANKTKTKSHLPLSFTQFLFTSNFFQSRAWASSKGSLKVPKPKL